MNNTIGVKGMHCASCASIIEKTLKKDEAVKSVAVNYGTETAQIDFDKNDTSLSKLSKQIEPLGYSLSMPDAEDHSMHTGVHQSKEEKLAELNDMRTKVISVMPLALISLIIMGWDILAQFEMISQTSHFVSEFFHHLLPIFATYTLFVVGKPYLMGAYRFFRYGKANMDSLVGIGTSAAFLYSFIVTAFEESLRHYINVDHTYYDVTIVVIAFITLGKYLEVKAKLKTGDAIEKLLNLQAKTALIIRDNKEMEILLNEVIHGDTIIVKPASKIPVDGVVLEGSSFVDEAMITGEPMPVKKEPGNSVVAGTVNTSGTFTFKATKIGSETLLSQIVTMVQEAQGSKAPIQGLADKISGVFVPIVMVIAVVSLIAWLIIGNQYFDFSQALSYGLVSFVSILVIACPCALGLATPTAIIVGVGKGAKEGILIKDAASLEKLHTVTTVVVDKTGTITQGKPTLVSVQSLSDISEDIIISILASLESRSEHPIAHAVISYAKEKNIMIQPIENFEIIKGKGLKATIKGVEYFVGNNKLVHDLDLKLDTSVINSETEKGATPIILMTKDIVLGIVMVTDPIKSNAKEAIGLLHELGMKVIMLTGDNKNTAQYIAHQVGIDEVVSEVLPQEKLDKIKELQKHGQIVAMAGDGVNDAPALAQADIGIAMATGTDVAIETASIILLHGDISKLVKAIRLSKLTMRGIKQNLFWAFVYNIIGIPLAAGVFFPFFGWLLNPIFAGLAMGLSSVSVVTNSLRLKTIKL